ncbi:MAG TPA: 2-phospho-L-lactate transferase [Anaerolineae bacterium]|nr:2-phospho-L-lactate transferase [Anaerolineae bacterium]HID84409.1 2-phospho-L-lactate transferase [Anaerolineales bacterium]HIQ09741.1 2-phospho-L-lactate transferase [Anaerolineaceae bacterium]
MTSLERVVVLAGGVGGARFAAGVVQVLPPERVTVVVNVGDDFEHWGLWISPDLDTVCYTLAGLENRTAGWGRRGESWRVLEEVRRLGGPDWFRLGDLDLATHLERTRRLRAGEPLSRIVADFCRAWGVRAKVLPISDDRIPTLVETDEGTLAFQEYFVHRRWQPRVKGFRFQGAERARPAPGVMEALRQADAVLFAPSNPWVSLDPILALPGVREAVAAAPAVVGVSPIIGGRAVKGPAAKMFREMGEEPSPMAVARHYRGLWQGMLIDAEDEGLEEAVAQALGGGLVWARDTWMSTPEKRVAVARCALKLADAVRANASHYF